jgi:hypothetical protein
LETIKLSEPLPLQELVMLALEDPESNFNKDVDGDPNKVAKSVVSVLVRHAPMLKEYVSFVERA